MAKPRQVELALNAPQREAFAALFDERGQPYRGRTVFLGWGRGVGKSWYRRQVWYLLVALLDGKLRRDALKPFRGVRITSLAPTLKQWTDIHWSGLLDELTGAGDWAWLGAKLDGTTRQIRFPGGSIIRPFPATAHNARTARGMRTDVLDADEYDDIDGEVYDAIAVPWLSEPWSLGIELPGGTPTRGRHGLWWRTLQAGRLGERLRNGEEPPPDLGPDEVEAFKSIYAFHATYKDAPETVSPKAVAKAKATTLPATFEREWEANPDAGEGLVYPFDESFHVREPPPISAFSEFHVGGDHGWVDPGVLIHFGVQGHGNDATAWALDEWYESEVPNEEWDRRAQNWRHATFWADPSRPDRIATWRGLNLSIGDVDNEIFGGIARVADMLFRRKQENGPDWCRFYVSPKCRNLIREFGLYRRKKLPDGTFAEKPEDKNNHAMDSTRYFLMGRFGKPVNYRYEIRG